MTLPIPTYDSTVVKPILRYPGGKWRIARWIIENMPAHKSYVEPYGGAASVLLRKSRSFTEVYNDLDSEVVNLFRVLRDKVGFTELERIMRYTPFSREEYYAAFENCEIPVEQARRFIVRSWMSYSAMGVTRRTGFKNNGAKPTRSTSAMDWRKLVTHLHFIADRLMGVEIENRPAVDIMRVYDAPDTLFYLDPPYSFDTRSDKMYKHEMDNAGHEQLAEAVHGLKGMAMVSGYQCELYSRLYPDWHRIDRGSQDGQGATKTESIWISPNTWEAIQLTRPAVAMTISPPLQLGMFDTLAAAE